MGQINMGKPIDTSLIKCCSCSKGYEIKGNLYQNKDNILVCPHCGLRHKIIFKLIDKKIENLKKINKLNLAAIDIGSVASDRGNLIADETLVLIDNPANETGTITSIEIWAAVEIPSGSCQVGTFFVVSGNNLSTRDTVTLGLVAAGSKQTITEDSASNPIALEVEAGDYIGVYVISPGRIEYDDSGEAGLWWKAGDQVPCTNEEFAVASGDTISIYATGETAGADFEYAGVATGGEFTFSGSATLSLGFSSTASGSFTFSGTATQEHSKDYLISGSGELAFSGSAVIIIGLSYSGLAGKWSGLGMGTFWSYDSYVDTLLANGFTELRIDIPSYENTEWLGYSKTAVISAIAKGAKVIWGISTNTTLTSSNWTAYANAVKSGAQWAQDNGVFEFQIGNELDDCLDGTTLTTAQLYTNLHTLATEVQAIFTNGNVSYACLQGYVNRWISLGLEAPNLFADNFENGNLYAWDVKTNNVNNDNISVTEAAAINGNYGLSCFIENTTPMYVYHYMLNEEKRYRCKFYIDPNSLTMADGDEFNILVTNNPLQEIFFVILGYTTAGGYYIRVPALDDSEDWVGTSAYTITDEPHYIEVDWKASSGVGEDDGTIELLIDGVSKETVSAIDSDTESISCVLLGACSNIDVGTSGTFYLDDFQSNNDGSAFVAEVWDYDLVTGDIDILSSNVYMGGETFDDMWKGRITNLVDALGGSGTYLTEFGPSSTNLETYSEDESVQAAAVTEMINYIKASGMTRAIYFMWKDDGAATFGVLKGDETYRLLWLSLQNSGVSLEFSGTATCVFELSYVASGSFDYSGEAVQEHSKDYVYATDGTLTFSGAGVCVLGFSHTGTGTLLFSGSADTIKQYYICIGSGSFNFSGEGICISEEGFLYEGSGSFAYSGTATQSYTWNYSCVASGSFVYSGVASYSFGVSYTGNGTGGFAFSGSAECEYTYVAEFEYVSSGSFVYSGTAIQVHARYYLYSGSGEFIYSGSAVVEKFHFIFVGDGTLIFSGEASAVYHYGWIRIDKKGTNWTKQDKIYMGWLVNGWLIYGWLIDIWEKIIKSTSNWNKVEKE